MANILIIYSTTDGHTLTICERIAERLRGADHRVSIHPIEAPQAVPDGFDKIVIGASIRYGKHNPLVGQFIQGNRDLLERTPHAFFSVNAVARKPEKRTPETNPYVRKFLARLDWQPQHAAVFGGKIDYPRYRFWDRQIIRFIMWMTKGPTDPNGTYEFTDWDAVDDFADRVEAL